MNILINPTVVTLSFGQDELSNYLVSAKDGNGTELASFSILRLPDTPPKLLMRDNQSGITYECIPREEDFSDINQLYEFMLNKVNLTRIQRVAKGE